MKKFILMLIVMLSFFKAFCSENVLGLWKTIDDETQKPKSIVCLYEKDKKLYGRIIAVYSLETGKIIDTLLTQNRIAENVKGKPKTCGLDFIWNMVKDGDEWADGEIMDPAKGKIYNCVIWYDKKEGILNVRGKILFIGRTQKWKRLENGELPEGLNIDPKTFTPVVIK